MHDHPTSNSGGANDPSPDPDVFRVILHAPDRPSLAKAVRELGLDIDHQHPARREGHDEVDIEAFLTQRQIDELKRRGWRLRVEQNLSEIGRERQKEVGKGDRFQGGKVTPRGLGKKNKIREDK